MELVHVDFGSIFEGLKNFFHLIIDSFTIIYDTLVL
jgi:hypothetical protein